MMWGNFWPYRSTLIKEVNSSGPWQVVELSEEYMYKDDCGGLLVGCEVDHDILTIMGVHAHGVEYSGVLCEDSPAPVDNPGVDIPLVDGGDAAMPEEVQHAAPHAAEPDVGAEVAGDVDVQVEIPERISIEGLELTPQSSVHDLRRICKYFGINQSGSKKKMYERIVRCHIIALWRKEASIRCRSTFV